MGFLALIIHFFFSINYIFSIMIVSFGLYLFLKKIKIINLKKISFCFFFAILITLLTLLYSQHPIDSEMYHHPYVSYLNKEKIILGLVNLQFRFGHISFLQYFQAITLNNYLSLQNISFANIFLFTSFIIFAVGKLIQANKINYLNIVILSFLVFTLIKLGRYREWGNDLIPLIVCFYFSFKFIQAKFFIQKKLLINLSTIFFIFLLVHKVSYIFAPLFLFYFLSEKYFFRELFNFKYFVFSLSLGLLWIIKNFLVSSCLIYPITFTCLPNDLIIATGLANSSQASFLTELWSKDFITHPDWRNLNLNLYIQDFNWLSNWLNSHFIKILEITSSIYLLFFILYAHLFLKKQILVVGIETSLQFSKVYFLIFAISIGLLIWFLKAPLFRYGTFYIVGFLVFTFSLIYLKLINGKFFFKNNLLKFLVISSIIFFVSKNILRISNSENSLLPRTFNDNIVLLKEKYNLKLYTSKIDVCHYTSFVCSHEIPKNVNIKLFFSYKNIQN